MKIKFIKILIVFITILSAANGFSQSGYSLIKKISLPGNGSWDYLKIDEDQRLFVSHFDRVHVINLNTDKETDEIKNLHGAKHIILLKQLNKGFISNGDNNTVLIFNYTTLDSITTIKIKGTKPDPMCYDAFSKKIYVFCDNNTASIIDPVNNKETGQIKLKGDPEFALPDGKGLIYNNLENKNAIEVIDVRKKEVIKIFSLKKNAAPTGMAADMENNRLFVACRGISELAVLDLNTGKIISSLPIGEKVDGVYFDPGNKYIFCSGGNGTLTIIREQSKNDYRPVENLTTPKGSKTMALDIKTHKLYLSSSAFEKGTDSMVPDTFFVSVYGLKN